MKPIFTSCLIVLFLLRNASPAYAQGYCADGIVYFTENHTVAYDDVVYKQAAAIDEWFFEIPQNIRLRVYHPTDLTEGDKRPLIVLIHGGFFIAGSYLDFDAFAKRFAELGFIAATIDYRLCKRNDCLLANVISPCNISWGNSIRPSSYVAAVDVNDGIRWLQQHAADYFIDPEKVIVSGHSAGAFTALNVAFLDQSEIQQIMPGAGLPGHDYLSEPLDPVEGIQAVVSMAGATLNPDWIEASEIIDEQIAVGLVHGTSDGVVDYGAAEVIPCCNTYQTIVYGACPVAERVQELGGNLFILSGEGFGHDINDSLFLESIMEQVPAFIIKTVLCGESISLHTSVQREQALDGCPNGSEQASPVCDVLPITPEGLIVPVHETPARPTVHAIKSSPSPLRGNILHVALESPVTADYQCFIQDQNGKILIHRQLHLSAGAQQFDMDMPLPAGVYYLYLTTEHTHFEALRIVKL
jgi:dienelactone hydrolase